MNKPLVNVSGDIERILNDMWDQLREAMPELGRDVAIQIDSWEYSHQDGRHTKVLVWNKSDFIKVRECQENPKNNSSEIPIKNWDKFIASCAFKKRNEILFRRFK